jgi:hypothetical protein
MDNYHIYSDESSSPDNRYRTLCAVSGEENSVKHLRGILQNILKETGVTEVKFEEIGTHSPKIKAAAKFIEAGILEAANKNIRIDVLLWDIQDSRHSIMGRDDIANFGRMYYKMIRHIGRKWDIQRWFFYPDTLSSVNWLDISQCLNKTTLEKYPSELLDFFRNKGQLFFVREVRPQESHKEPIVQLADIFAGFSWFSRIKGNDFLKWREHLNTQKQPCLFSTNDNSQNFSRLTEKTVNRFKLLNMIIKLCREYKLGVSIKTNKRLTTFGPASQINFWTYEVQTDMDKAPVRKDTRKK